MITGLKRNYTFKRVIIVSILMILRRYLEEKSRNQRKDYTNRKIVIIRR
jgi:hypothetical protein